MSYTEGTIMEDEKPFKTITATDLKKKMDAGENLVLVDVLGEEYYKNRHVPHAINIPISLENFEEVATKTLPDKNKPVIVYCASKQCLASPGAAKKLVEMGYTDVTDFDGGIQEWEEAGYEFET